MKLAFCLFKYFPYGGLQRDFLRIAETCRRRGHEIHVYTMQWEGDFHPEFHLHMIEPSGWQNHERCQSFAKQLTAALAKEHYDLVIGFNKLPGLDFYYAADVCYQTRAREKHSWWYQFLPRYKQQVALEEAVFARGLKTEILLISAKQQPEYQRCYHTESERFHLLPPGIARDRMAPTNAAEIRAAIRGIYNLAKDDLMLLMVGSGFKTKGLDRSLLAFAHLPERERARCKLFVIGQDRARPFIKQAQQLGIHEQVHFLGGRPDVPDFLLAADILLHPAYHENTGTVLLEAMIAGLPVLTVDVCGYAHYIKDYDVGKVLDSPFSQDALDDALLEMITSPKREQWHKNGLVFAQTADIYSMPERAADLIESKLKADFSSKHNAAINLSFDDAMALQGEKFRALEGRLTQRVTINQQTYFIKQHHGVGWKEIFKNLFQLRLPVLSARNEWLAIQKLQKLGVAVPALIAYGERGLNPATRRSFVLMQELSPIISLEDLTRDWREHVPAYKFKQALISEVARIARTVHANGMNHRDFYICHFLLDITDGLENIALNNIKLYLIDLHRAQIRRHTPQRWVIKDLAGLYFSSKDIGLTQRDLLRFMQAYRGEPLREIINREKHFWEKVKTRGEQLYRDHTE